MRLLLSVLAFAILSAIAVSAPAAERNVIEFDARLRGVEVGSLRLAIREDGADYSVEARVGAAGLLSVVRSFSYVGVAEGALRAGTPQPARFEEVADTGRRTSRVLLDYAGGAPRVVRYESSNPPGPDAPDPASQGDTVDPTTALFAIFRDQPAGDACDRRILMYDGMRRSHVVLGAARRDGDTVICTGEYRRLRGFTDKELARNVAFPLEVMFAPVGGGLVRAARVEITSSYGLATLDRR